MADTEYVDCVWKENLDGECGLTCNIYVPGNLVGVLSQKELTLVSSLRLVAVYEVKIRIFKNLGW